MSFEEDAKGKKRMVKKEIVDFGDSSRSYEGLVSCQLGVYTGFQNKSPTWGIYLTASEAYLSDPEGESPGGMKSLAASETITLDDEGDDAIEVTVDPARLLVSSMGDQEVDEDDLRSEDSASVGGNAHEKSGIPLARLQESYDRGIGAWKTNPSSVRNLKGVKGGPGKRMPKEQWACARVNKLARLKSKAGYDQDLLGKGKAPRLRSVTATRV